MKIGLIPMSAKPYHAGHHKMIIDASNENDIIQVFISLKDRHRKNEIKIQGNTMKTIWDLYLKQIIPKNVNINFVDVPVRKIYEILGNADKNCSLDDFIVYSGIDDLEKNFAEKYLIKYMKRLFESQQLVLKPTTRLVSGTQMREYIANNSMNLFMDNLPNELTTEKKQQIFKLLKNET